MRSGVVAVAVLLVGVVVGAPTKPQPDDVLEPSPELYSQFVDWAKENNKPYLDSPAEFNHRFRSFRVNAKVVLDHTMKQRLPADEQPSYEISLSGPFADMTFEEFSAAYLQAPQFCSATSSGPVAYDQVAVTKFWNTDGLPDAVDWRNKSVITPVKDQGNCGSCWTFSTTGTLEAHTCIKEGRDCSSWTGLAEQQLVDCAQAFNNNGCDGGLPSQAFEYIFYAGGIETETAYPYTAKDGTCKFSGESIGATTRGSHNITALAEEEIVQAVASVGPVSIAFQVAGDFHLYHNGVYDSSVCKNGPQDVNHAVVVVGYNTTPAGKDYYIIRNSWGKSWGVEGHFLMVRDKNMCGIADCASYPLL